MPQKDLTDIEGVDVPQSSPTLYNPQHETLQQSNSHTFENTNNEPQNMNHLPESFTQHQQHVLENQNQASGLYGHMDYAPDLLAPENTSMSTAMHGVSALPSVNGLSEDLFDQSAWDPNQLSTINWLQMDAVNLDYIPMRDFFPTALSGDNFPSPNSWPYSIASPTAHGATMTLQPAASEANTDSPQDNFNHSSISNSALGDRPAADDTERGSYYVDGDKARRTRRKRRKLMHTGSNLPVTNFDFAPCLDIPPTDSASDIDSHINEEQHQQLAAQFQTLCIDTTFFRPFSSIAFPSREGIHRLVQSYFDSFHQSMPFLHRPSFRGTGRSHTLLLAMAALGARFVEYESAISLSESLTELLRRIILHAGESRANGNNNKSKMIEVRLLYSVVAGFSGAVDPLISLRECASTFESPFGQRTRHRIVPRNESEWVTWVHYEESARLKFCVWLLDCIIASHTGSNPLLKLADISDVQLPCTETLWIAATWEEWTAVHQSSAIETPTLDKALQELYIGKRLPPSLGEFARIIVIHGLYHRTWDVREYLQQPLSHFEPSAQRQPNADAPSPLPVWHPTMELFNKWRNSSLDCIDILHWNANASIGLAQGLEHPTVLHLHFSRIALLCPVKQVLRLARFLSDTGTARISPPSFDEAEHDVRMLQQWVAQDQYKARLATIHAGSIFWHVRRYSTGAFYEPECVAIGTLMLWAHSKFFVRSSQNRGAGDARQLKEDCGMILLDRPVDDELVQQFVREGDQMHANIKGVGDLFGPEGAQRVLGQGRALLGTLSAWPETSARWIDLLTKLENAGKGSNELSREK